MKRVTLRHWEILNEAGLMHPKLFRSIWGIGSSELSKICFCSERTVRTWDKGRDPIPEKYMRILALTHQEWLNQDQHPNYVKLVKNRQAQLTSELRRIRV